MKKVSVIWLILIQWVLAYQWLHSGWGKWTQIGFMSNISKSLEGFAAKTSYTIYSGFLKSTAIPNAELFGNLIRGGEIAVGIALVLGGILLLKLKHLPTYAIWLVIIAFFGGALMNLNFFLAAGWTSPSTWGVNVVMGLTHLILGLYYLLNRRELNQNA
jgi:uncharacterized membrane protein YphA (DoxX/SURF4 family)